MFKFEDEKPPLEEINEEYARYKFGYKNVPSNYGQNLQGSQPVLMAGNQIVEQQSIVQGAGEGGRRAGYQYEKVGIVDNTEI